jgi:hypothetical protein
LLSSCERLLLSSIVDEELLALFRGGWILDDEDKDEEDYGWSRCSSRDGSIFDVCTFDSLRCSSRGENGGGGGSVETEKQPRRRNERSFVQD